MYRVIFTRAARAELIASQGWYENEVPGLGRRFREAVDFVTKRIVDNPCQFPIVYKAVHRALLRRFPYSLLFVVRTDNTLAIIACFHSSRDPAHWQKRTEIKS